MLSQTGRNAIIEGEEIEEEGHEREGGSTIKPRRE